MLRYLKWCLAKRRLARGHDGLWTKHVQVYPRPQQSKAADFPQTVSQYSQLAAHWSKFAVSFVPAYARFISDLSGYYRFPVDSVLDLACGTGLMTRDLAAHMSSVVGLDVNDAMLSQAKVETNETNVRYVRGDFRQFDIGRVFDAAICGSDSVNYLETPDELVDLFRSTRRHLSPGGFFVFDALDHYSMLASSVWKTIVAVDGSHFELHLFYDPHSKVSEARVVFGDCVERHRRIAINPNDVKRAAKNAGLSFISCFPSCPEGRYFYLLRNMQPGSAATT